MHKSWPHEESIMYIKDAITLNGCVQQILLMKSADIASYTIIGLALPVKCQVVDEHHPENAIIV